MWLLGNGAKMFPFKKSKTLIPSRSVTMPFAELGPSHHPSKHLLTDVVSVVKTIPQMDAFVLVLLIVEPEGREHPQLDSARISVLLYRSDDFDGAFRLFGSIVGFHHLPKRALTEELRNQVFQIVRIASMRGFSGSTYIWASNLYQAARCSDLRHRQPSAGYGFHSMTQSVVSLRIHKDD
jgi:hypothetical protein